MAKINRNSKTFYIIFGAIDALLLLATVFLLVTAIIFRGSSAPSLFGHNVFLVDSDAFSIVKKGSALIVDKVNPKDIAPGNIIIFTDEEERNRIGEVQETASDGGIYTFTVKNDAGGSVAVGQSHIVGKGVYYSEFIGGIVSFATSPAGICIIAILPCAAFVIFEVIGIIRRRAPQPEVDTVKKQYETPTYIPPIRQAEAEEEKPAFSSERQKLVEAAGLFTPPAPKKAEPQPKPEERAPISGRAIDQLIKETKAKHEREAFAGGGIAEAKQRQPQSRQPADLAQAGRQAVAAAAYRAAVEDKPGIELTAEDERPHTAAEENVRQYVPPRRPTVRLSPRVSRLDSLLRDEGGEEEYNVDDILRSLEK